MSLDLLSLVAVAQNQRGSYTGQCMSGAGLRVFGGQVVAQALYASALARPQEALPHSVHAHFLAPGEVARPMTYAVQQLKVGRRFVVSRVDAHQGDLLVASVVVSFHVPEASPEHAVLAPVVPAPEQGPPLPVAVVGGPSQAFGPIESRWVAADPQPEAGVGDDGPNHDGGADDIAPSLRLWQRCRSPLSPDPVLHACGIVWMSDLTMTRVVDLPYSRLGGRRTAASLDHTVWLHRPIRADEWVLSVQQSPTFAAGRGLTTVRYFSRQGELVASGSQESLLRRDW